MRIPEHIAVIPDGNRRWAVAHGMAKGDGYHYGLRPGLLLLRRAKELGIREITYYGFTVDNCKRPSEQVGAFRRACVDAAELLKAGRRGFFGTWKYKIPVFSGRIKRVPGAEKSGRWRHPPEFFGELRLGMGSGAYEKGWKTGVVGCFEDRPRPAVGRQKPPFRAAPDPVCVCRFLYDSAYVAGF